ncbi:class I SAM-dependent methyltransferase [Paenisporosarcina quisquiliarum]|uniref:Class I SAM-dependent methyltransferase n=1 Tax=Paenisporosarcina quisquiliarum TaxID=365346 RepID=A0A9X3LF73_9BACL|nr:class I SAM-dependent methyltransferase [Paenisporosarcina quisquiliarum]MCZ8536933.1 class I SAM-dependent methyltransferase [Paenisporosarcina quisquiliarum]
MSYIGSKNEFVTMDLSEMRPEGFLQTILDRQKNNIDTVNSSNGWKVRVNCPICQSSKSTYQFEKHDFHLVQCDVCSTAYFDQVPINTNDIYSAPHAIGDAQEAYLVNKDYRKIRFATERVQLIEQHLVSQIKDVDILDVGCGTGWFLETAKDKGANCFGVELGKDLAKFTAERLEITVWNCDLTELDTIKKFDVVTMFDLIEHVENPLLLINSAKELLKDNGIIVIFTPQFDSVAIKTMKDKSNLIMPAEHLSYFTEKTVEKVAELSDMEVVYYATKGIDMGDLKSFYEYNNQPQLAESCASLYDTLQPTIDSSKSGNHLRAILKKV